MSVTHAQVVEDFFEYHRNLEHLFLGERYARSMTMLVRRASETNHYGRPQSLAGVPDTMLVLELHYQPLALSIPSVDLLLVNGTVPRLGGWGHSGWREQMNCLNEARKARPNEHPLIVPFEVLQSAGIHLDSIQRVEVRNEEWIVTEHVSATKPRGWRGDAAVQDADGLWRWTTNDHSLGAALFEADYAEARSIRVNGECEYQEHRGHALFLSDFDHQEPTRSYFLCQLPEGAKARGVAEALEALKPDEVRSAEKRYQQVTRQGDIFAVPTTLTTGELLHNSTTQRAIVKMARLLGTSHVASEVVDMGDTTYARGFLHHRPEGFRRRPEHQRRVIGDGETWHRIVMNTVPRQALMATLPRAWQVVGRVD